METFPFIANNFIRNVRKCLATGMAMILMGILCIGCTKSALMETREASGETVETTGETNAVEETRTTQDTSDTAADTEEDIPEEPSKDVTIADMNQATSTPEEQEALLRDHNRTEMNTKLLQCREREGEEWIVHLFDLLCKLFVSESKVRQGIFHFRLQSDDEEAPQGRRIA